MSAKTFYAAAVVFEDGSTVNDQGQTLYLWKFRKGAKRGWSAGLIFAETTYDQHRALIRTTAASIEENIRKAQMLSGLEFAIVEFEVLSEYSAYTYGIQGAAAQRAAGIEGAFVFNYGDFVYVLRKKSDQSVKEAAEPEAAAPAVAPFEGNLTEGDVIVHAEDWALIQEVMRDMMANDYISEEAQQCLLAMKVSIAIFDPEA